MKRWKPIGRKRRNATAIATRTGRHYCIPQKSGPSPPLERSQKGDVIPNVAASRPRFLPTRKSRRGTSRISATLHLPYPPDRIGAGHLRQMSSTSGRGGKDISSMKEKLSKGVGDPASNTSFDGSRLGWMVLVSRRRNCCKPGRRRRCQKVGVGPKAPLKQLPSHLLLAYTTSKRVVLGMASADTCTRLFPFNSTVDLTKN